MNSSEIMQKSLLVMNLNSLPRSPSMSDEQLMDKLTIHFQNRKNSRGGDVEKVIYPVQRNSDYAIVIFAYKKDRDSALHHEQVFNKEPLEVSKLPPVFTSIRAEMHPLYFEMMPPDIHGDFLERFQQLTDVTIDKSNYGKISCTRPSQLERVEKEVLHLVLDGRDDPHHSDISQELEAAGACGVDHKAEEEMQMAAAGAVNEESSKEIFQEGYDNKKSSDEEETFMECTEEMQDVNKTQTFEELAATHRSPLTSEDLTSGKAANGHHVVEENSVIVDMYILEFIQAFESESLKEILKGYKVIQTFVPDRAGENVKAFTFTSSSKSRAEDVAEAREKFITLYQKVSNGVSRKTIDCSAASKARVKEATKKIRSDFKEDTIVCNLDGSHSRRLILRRGDVDEVARKFREFAGIKLRKALRKHAPDAQSVIAPKTDVAQSEGLSYQATLGNPELEQPDGTLSFVTNEGITVVVRRDDITKQSVQALVSPTNESLANSGGVAKAVFAAAGLELDRYCKNHVRSSWYRQPLQVTKCIATPGFKLKSSIVHACGPPNFDSRHLPWYQSQLYETFKNCFHTADNMKFQSLAIPLIGSGVSAAPKHVCADVLVQAIVDYSFSSRGNTMLKKLVLVNIDRESTEAIKQSLAFRANAAGGYNMSKMHDIHGADVTRHNDVIDGQERDQRPGQNHFLPGTGHTDGRIAVKCPLGAAFSASGSTSTSLVASGTPMAGSSAFGTSPTSSVASGAPTTSSTASGAPTTSSTASGVPTTSSTASGVMPASSVTSGTPLAGDSAFGTSPRSSTASGAPSTSFVASGSMPTRSVTSGTTPTGTAAFGTTSTSFAALSAPPAVSTRDSDRAHCPICLKDVIIDEVILKCKHRFCKVCLDKALETSYRCPVCQAVCGEPKGNQPKGATMTSSTLGSSHLDGYPNDGIITICYNIPSGYQTACHPNPGKYFTGTSRTAYLPDNDEGREVLHLLRKAFDAGLVFTIGRSVTSGLENMVTWNDIHHKTSKSGGPAHHGYPDPDYLKRVKEDLKVKGIE